MPSSLAHHWGTGIRLCPSHPAACSPKDPQRLGAHVHDYTHRGRNQRVLWALGSTSRTGGIPHGEARACRTASNLRLRTHPNSPIAWSAYGVGHATPPKRRTSLAGQHADALKATAWHEDRRAIPPASLTLIKEPNPFPKGELDRYIQAASNNQLFRVTPTADSARCVKLMGRTPAEAEFWIVPKVIVANIERFLFRNDVSVPKHFPL